MVFHRRKLVFFLPESPPELEVFFREHPFSASERLY
jgi:hypothetical protein